MIDLPETSELRAFVAIVEAESVSGAARELGLPRATVSRRLARLEEQLDARLLHRTTRRMQLTDLGEELFGHARAIVGAVAAAAAAVSQDDSAPRGPLRVSVPPSAEAGLRPMLLDFVVTHPQVQLEVIASSTYEDLLSRNIDVALRAGTDLVVDGYGTAAGDNVGNWTYQGAPISTGSVCRRDICGTHCQL